MEDEVVVLHQVDHAGGRGPDQQERGLGRRIHNAVMGVQRYGKQRTLVPLEHLLAEFIFLPDLSRPSALHDKNHFFVQVLLRVEGTPSRNLYDVHSPPTLGAIKLEERAPTTQPLPRPQRYVLQLTHTDATEGRDAFLLHESVVWRRRLLPTSPARHLAFSRLLPLVLASLSAHQ